MSTQAPPWFRNALALPPENHRMDHDGATLNYVSWGQRESPGLLLIHGGAAHVGWWSFLAPLLSNDYFVVALDLSGHGDSSYRDHYAMSIFAADAMAVVAAEFREPPILVGHSMGGLVSIVCAAKHGEALAGAVIVDSPVRKQDPESREGQYGRSFRNAKHYPSLEEALQRFRLVPEQPCANQFIVNHIAQTSLKETPNGWTWKFDPNIFVRYTRESIADHLRNVRCRIAMMRGEYSTVVPPETGLFMYDLLNRNAPLIEIPDAHHHLILDQPLAFVAALRAILADWEHSVPRHALDRRAPGAG